MTMAEGLGTTEECWGELRGSCCSVEWSWLGVEWSVLVLEDYTLIYIWIILISCNMCWNQTITKRDLLFLSVVNLGRFVISRSLSVCIFSSGIIVTLSRRHEIFAPDSSVYIFSSGTIVTLSRRHQIFVSRIGPWHSWTLKLVRVSWDWRYFWTLWSGPITWKQAIDLGINFAIGFRTEDQRKFLAKFVRSAKALKKFVRSAKVFSPSTLKHTHRESFLLTKAKMHLQRKFFF